MELTKTKRNKSCGLSTKAPRITCGNFWNIELSRNSDQGRQTTHVMKTAWRRQVREEEGARPRQRSLHLDSTRPTGRVRRHVSSTYSRPKLGLATIAATSIFSYAVMQVDYTCTCIFSCSSRVCVTRGTFSCPLSHLHPFPQICWIPRATFRSSFVVPLSARSRCFSGTSHLSCPNQSRV